MRVRKLMASLFVAALPVACATNPVTGQPEFVLMSGEREAQVGREGAKEVAEQIGLVDDPALQAYVEAVGQRVAKQSPRQEVPYRFAVVDMPEPNAFALPGGYIYVSRGLLAITNSEDELANVLGHEIAHVAARHSAQRETQALGVGILSALGTLAAGVLGGAQAAQAVGQLGQVAGAGLIASYGRDQEREADRVGQQMSAAAGVDPSAMASFLRTLENETRLQTGSSRRPSFFDSHPATPERVANAATLARTLSFTPGPRIAGDTADLYARFEGLVVGPSASEGVFREQVFLHPDLDLRLRFPEGWKTQNSRSAVLGGSPQQDAIVAVELQGRGDDPRAAAAAFLRAKQLRAAESDAFRVGALPAFRVLSVADTQQGRIALELAWVAYNGSIYRFTGMTPPERYRARAAELRSVARSLRPLTAEERAGIVEWRLRVVRARAGETVAQLASRSASAWSANEIAVANGLTIETRLDAGQPVKLAIEQPYRPRPAPAAESAPGPLGER